MTHPIVSVRPLAAADYPVWSALWQAYLHFYQTELPQAVSDATWQKLLADDVPVWGWGAFHHGRLVGFAHTVLHPNTWHTTDCCYLEDLFVDESARRQGVARSLIEAVYAEAARRRCNRVYWVTQSDNHAAQALYTQLARQTDMIQFRHDLAI